jgi:hypothetical protein
MIYVSLLFVKGSLHEISLSAMQGNGGVMPNRRDFQINPDSKSWNKHPLEVNYTPDTGSLGRRHTDQRSIDGHLEPFQGMRDGDNIVA